MIAADKDRVVVLHLDLAARIGRTEALLLAQIDYWLERSHKFVAGRFWVYNTLDEWGRQLGVSASRVKQAARRLEEMGLIERRRLNRAPYDRTLSYTICYGKLREMGFAAGRRATAPAKADPWDMPLGEAERGGLDAIERTGADKWAI